MLAVSIKTYTDDDYDDDDDDDDDDILLFIIMTMMGITATSARACGRYCSWLLQPLLQRLRQ